MAVNSFAFRVAGIEPRGDPAWHLASEMVHRAFWRAVVAFVLVQKDRELARGRDRFGEALVPIAESTRRKGRWRSYTGMGSAINPPLTPANRLSRTRDLFTGRAMATHAEFFWRFDSVSGRHWGQILGYHRAGVGRLPVRDVIGLSPMSLGVVKRQANRWWLAWKAGSPLGAAEAAQFKVHVPAAEERPRPAPRKIVATGRTDTTYITFGIGGGKEEFERRVAAGTTTGFRQRPARILPTRIKAKR